MTVRRRALLVVLAAVLGIAGALWAVPADALEGEQFTIKARATTEVDQPGIPGNDPASSQGSTIVGSPTPDNCVLSPSCMVVPVDIEVPGDIEPGDDFVVNIEFSWDAPSGLEDLDFWIFDDGQMAEREGTTGYTEVGSSASADIPEKIGLYEPLLGRYNIVANNFSGANASWHIKAVSSVGEFETPFESLAPPPGGGTTNPGNKPTTTTTRPTTTTTVPTTTTVSIPEGVVLPDDDFESGEFDPATALDQLAADEETLAAIEAGGRRAESPSAMSVILWLLVIPAVLLGAVAAYLASRRQKLRLKLSR